MTDNRVIELREKLQERGVEYDGRLLYETEWTVNGITWHAKEYDGMLNVYVRNNDLMLTPEQAIAATLGNEREKALEELVQDVWAAYCAKAESSFHPAWEVDSELARRMAAFEFKVIDE